MPDALVGRQLKNNAWIKTVVSPTNEDETRQTCIGVLGSGWKIEMTEYRAATCCFMLKDEFRTHWACDKWVAFADLTGDLLDNNELSRSTSFEDAPVDDCISHQHTLRGLSLKRTKTNLESFEFGSFETYIFAPQGTIYNIDDPDQKRTEEELKELRQEIVNKVNELMFADNKRVLFVSNNSKESRKGIAVNLKNAGIRFKGSE
jgi:hypothetical protein